MRKNERYRLVLDYFRATQPSAQSELEFGTAFQLLVAVVLSAQCTDKRVNIVTRELFAAYPDAKALSEAEEQEVYEYVKSVSYPNAKTHHICQLARMLISDFGGDVPEDIDDLVKLPGVGRKTANVMLAVWFGKGAMPVDTHVFRVSHRLGLVPPGCNTPLKVEKELTRHIPEAELGVAHHWLLLHGRYVCTSRSPKCGKCPFDAYCPKIMQNT